MKRFLFSFFLIVSIGGYSQKNTQINVLILQVENVHDIDKQTQLFIDVLNNTGDYKIEQYVVAKDDSLTWSKFNYQFSDFELIISARLGQNMPGKMKAKFNSYLKNGGNFVMVHEGLSSFNDWATFHEIVGLGWFKWDAGDHIFWDENEGKFIRTPKYHGVGTGHGKQHEFLVTLRNTEHPITKGMPIEWMQGKDELFHGLRGRAQNIEILATAFSEKNTWGSGDHEPIAWTVQYGKGRVFVTTLGHVLKEEYAHFLPGLDMYENKEDAIYSVGFQTLFARGAEWAATGKVTIEIPMNFPSKSSSVSLSPDKVEWKK